MWLAKYLVLQDRKRFFVFLLRHFGQKEIILYIRAEIALIAVLGSFREV
jgi:hypothetical protein